MIVELDELTIPALLRRSFTLYRDLPAIAFVGEPPFTYSDVRDQSQVLAARLLNHSIRMGEKVAILGENSPQWVLAYIAITSIGAVAVPVLPGFPDSDARHIIRNSESVTVFVTENQRPKIENEDIPRVHTVFSLDDLSAEPVRTARSTLGEKARRFLAKGGDESPGDAEAVTAPVGPRPDDLAVLIYTSGTTGHSKGVMLTHRNIVSDVVNGIERFPLDSSDRFLSILPLSHTFEATGGMLCPLAVGVSIFYMQGLPTARKLLAAMQLVKPTGLLSVPLVVDNIYQKRILGQIKAKKLGGLYKISLFRKILNRMAGKKLIRSLGGHLRFFMLGGAATNEELEVFLQDAGIGYSTGYGMTEASPILTINPFGKVRMGSCGRPIPGVEVRILDPDPATGVGEIIVRGPNIMKGYYKNEDITRQAFLEDGWLKTGDLGLLDSDGYLYIKGRSKNVIVDASGENIYPETIEQKLMNNPYIQQAIVHQHEGRLIARAYLDQDVLDQDLGRHNLTEAEAGSLIRELLERIRIEVNQQLPAFSTIQEIIEHPDPFEMTPTKKIKRYLYTQ
jgi:long-chain acyl-CoA synthetase